jgi:DNA polymerase III delta subunit
MGIRNNLMAVGLLLAHGDDGLGLDEAVDALAHELGDVQRTDLLPERSPDEAILDRARVEAASVGLFGPHLVVLRRPLRAAGRSGTASEKLVALVRELPDGAALALLEERPSRDASRPPALLRRLADAVRERGGTVVERLAPRRAELSGWTRRHAAVLGIELEPRAAALLAERVGGAVWETDIERGEQTRVVDSELRKLATHAGSRPVGVEDVELLTPDTRPASVFAVTNAVDRREPAAAADALRRAFDEGQPVLRITASLHARIGDLIVAADLVARGATPAELTRAVGRGSARTAERVTAAARRYRPDELEAMLLGLFEADLAIKENRVEPESAVAAWLGEHLLATRSSVR